jgi:hypothetical protein
MITASRIKEKVDSYNLHQPNLLQFRVCISGEPFADQHRQVFDEISEELKTDPQQFYDRARSFVRNHKEINFALGKMKTGAKVEHEDPNVAVRPALDRIAKFWEAAPALRFYAFYLTGRKAPYEKMAESKAVLKNFKNLGLSASDATLLRQLRNAAYHPGNFKNGRVLSDKDEDICEIPRVFELVKIIDDINRWVMMMTFYLVIHNPRFTLTVISLLNYEYFNKKELYIHSLWPVYKLLGTSAVKEEAMPEQQQPAFARWITKVWPIVKSPRQALMGYALVEGITRKISGDFSKDYNRADVLKLLSTFRNKSLEAADLLRHYAEFSLEEESRAAFFQLAAAIERDARRRTDLTRPTQQNTIDFIVDSLNENLQREEP